MSCKCVNQQIWISCAVISSIWVFIQLTHLWAYFFTAQQSVPESMVCLMLSRIRFFFLIIKIYRYLSIMWQQISFLPFMNPTLVLRETFRLNSQKWSFAQPFPLSLGDNVHSLRGMWVISNVFLCSNNESLKSLLFVEQWREVSSRVLKWGGERNLICCMPMIFCKANEAIVI